MRVLLTDGTYKHALGIVRQLGQRHEVYVAARRRLAMAGVSRWTRRSLRCPPVYDETYVRWLDAAVRRHAIDQIVPVGAAACGLLSEHRERWMPATRVVLPPAATVRRALDKREMVRLGASLGLPVPGTVEPPSVDDLEACGDTVGFPLVIKAPVEGPGDVAYVDERQDLRGAYEAYLVRNRWADTSLPILQRRIVGDGYGVFATYQDGRCRRIMAHRRVREYPASGGVSTCAELVDDPSLLELGRRILDALGWHGVAMVEFKRHLDDRYYLMEVNPKFWGSLDLALAAGCDFPGDLLAIGSGADLPEHAPPSGHLRFCWPISGDLLHLRDRPADLPAVLRDWFAGSAKTNIRWTDPLPHVVELAETGRALLPRRR